jgi:hypothetical protein
MNRVEALVHIAQHGTPYRIAVDLEFVLDGGRTHRTRIHLTDAEQDVIVSLTERPLAVRLDPELHVFRRVARNALAPMLNLYVTDVQRTVLLPRVSSEQPSPFIDIVQRIVAQEASKPRMSHTTVRQPEDNDAGVPSGSLLVLGGPGENPTAADMLRYCGDRLRFTGKGFVVDGKAYEGATMALLMSCRRDDQPDSVVTILYGVTPQALGRVSRLLFFYGWQSYVVFHEGSVVARGDWEDRMTAEVRIETR